MAMISDPQCFDCIHLDRSGDFRILRCRAFPDEIPLPIQMNKHDHRKSYPGDHGIRFEPIAEPQAAAMITGNEPRKTAQPPRKTAKDRRRVPG
jgi:hypothetical protein